MCCKKKTRYNITNIKNGKWKERPNKKWTHDSKDETIKGKKIQIYRQKKISNDYYAYSRWSHTTFVMVTKLRYIAAIQNNISVYEWKTNRITTTTTTHSHALHRSNSKTALQQQHSLNWNSSNFFVCFFYILLSHTLNRFFVCSLYHPRIQLIHLAQIQQYRFIESQNTWKQKQLIFKKKQSKTRQIITHQNSSHF